MKKLSLVVLALVACENTTPEPQAPTPNPQYPSASATPAPPPPPPASASASVAAAPPPPPATAPAFPTFQLPNIQLPDLTALTKALPSLPIDPNLLNQIKQVGQQLMSLSSDPADAGLKAAAVQYAPLMLPEGAAYKDTLAPGAHKAFDVTLAGNKCYTIIAYSPSLTGVSLHLLVPPFYNMDAGHDDAASGTAAIKNVCPFTLIPIPYRVDVSARGGQGQVAVQVYSKTK